MSHSVNHDQYFEPVARWLRDNCGCRWTLIEPARPRSYGGDCWPSPDVWGRRSVLETIAVDVKVTEADALAQLHKTYVLDPSKGVGRHRYIAGPEGLGLSVPEGYGLLRITAKAECYEAEAPSAVAGSKGRNWEAEAYLNDKCERAVRISGEGMATDRGIHKRRGVAEKAKALLAEWGPTTAALLAKELGSKRQDVSRALDADPGVTFDKYAVPRVYELAGSKELATKG